MVCQVALAKIFLVVEDSLGSAIATGSSNFSSRQSVEAGQVPAGLLKATLQGQGPLAAEAKSYVTSCYTELGLKQQDWDMGLQDFPAEGALSMEELLKYIREKE